MEHSREFLVRGVPQGENKESPADARDLQEQLFKALSSGDLVAVGKLKKVYVEKYPDQLEGVECVFNLVPFLRLQDELNYRHDSIPKEELPKKLEEATEYQFLLMDFVIQNNRDKDFLSHFWKAAEQLTQNDNQEYLLERFRRSILSQVAVFRAFQRLELAPHISHPKEDAFHAIDIWITEERVAQVAGTKKRKSLIAEVEVMASPSVEIVLKEKKTHTGHFSGYLFNKFQGFRHRISEYAKHIGRDLKGYLISVPYKEFNHITGEPSATIVEQIRKALEDISAVDTQKAKQNKEDKESSEGIENESDKNEKPKKLKEAESDELIHDEINDIVNFELAVDIFKFAEAVQPIIRKVIHGMSLTSEERRIADLSRNTWWKRKYGFPYNKKKRRNELLSKKYAKVKESSVEESKSAPKAADEPLPIDQSSRWPEKWPEKVKFTNQGFVDLVKFECGLDIDKFPEAVRSSVVGWINGLPQKPDEQRKLRRAVNIWWHAKYGFPFDNKGRRTDFLRKKYTKVRDFLKSKD